MPNIFLKNIAVVSMKRLLLFIFILLIISPTAWSMEPDLKQGQYYKIRNKFSDTCLNNRGDRENGQGSVTMQICAKDQDASHRLWRFEEDGQYYEIKNKFSENCLNNWGGQAIGVGQVTMQTCAQDQDVCHRLWYFEKDGQYYKIRNKCSENCVDSGGRAIGQGTAAMQLCAKDQDADQRLWYFEKDGPHSPPTGLKLLGYSFLNGAAYSLFPEIVRDVLDFRGYSGVSNIAATLVQAGLIAYNTTSYVPTIAGFTVKNGFSYLGFSEETSTTAGSTAAVLSNVVSGLILEQEPAIDCVVNCAIAVCGSYAGSTLALKAKALAYDNFDYIKEHPVAFVSSAVGLTSSIIGIHKYFYQ